MSEETPTKNEDAFADALTAVLSILIPVAGIVYWLSGLPTS